MLFYLAFCKTNILWLLQKDYLPGRGESGCCKDFLPGRWEITIPKMKQCPTANHQARAEGAQKQTGCLAGWPETILNIHPKEQR